MTARWDIFCKVVDNFGDAGVCWRLAQQLVRRASLEVALWIDDPARARPHRARRRSARDAQRVGGVTIRRWSEPLPRRRRRGRRRRGVRLRAPRRLHAGDDAAHDAARLVRPRIPERRAVGRGRARASLAAPAPAARAPVLVSRVHADERRAAARAGLARRARRLPSAMSARAQRSGPSLAMPSPAAANVAFRCSAIRTRRCLRSSTRGPMATIPSPASFPKGRRRRDRRLDRRRRAASRPPGHARPARAPRDTVPRAGRLRPAALGLRRQFRPRRGLVRPRAMGGAALRVAHLSAGRGRALSASSTRSSTA